MTTGALNLAKSYVAAAVWCLHKAGLSVLKAAEEVDRVFDGRRVVDQNVRNPLAVGTG